MSLFSFKRDVELYAVFGSSRYRLDLSEINFSQTIQEKSYSDKTLQTQNFFERSKIYKANPANFSFTIPAIRELDLKNIFNRLLDCLEFTLYIKTQQDLFRIDTCVITGGKFIIDKNAPLKLQVTGEGSKLVRQGDASDSMSGTLVERAASRTYNRVSSTTIVIDSGTPITRLTEVNVELKNSIKWRDNLTITSCESGQTVTYPSDFYVEGKKLSGSFASYLIEDFEPFRNSELLIQVGDLVGATTYGFSFNLDKVSILPSLRTEEIFKYNYAWQYIGQVDSLFNLIEYITYPPGDEFAILDYLNQPILDYLNQPILESV